MDLLFDARLLHRGLSGIERVQRNLLRELAGLAKIRRLRALVHKGCPLDGWEGEPLPPGIEWVEVEHSDDILAILLDPKRAPDIYLLSYFPDRQPRDVFLPRCAPSAVVIVHDAILNRHPEYHPSAAAHAWYQRFCTLLLKGADRVLCFSQSSAREAVQDLAVDPGKIDITALAADPVMTRPLTEHELKERLAALHLHGDYFVALGKDYPHKDHATLLDALALLPASVHVVCAGARVFPHEKVGGQTLEQQAAQLGLENRVRWMEGLDDASIKAVLQGSRGLVYPSREEGFGLPPLEAMALGVPVTAAAAMSIPEVCADGALLFPPGDAHRLADHMTALLRRDDTVAALIERGRHRAASFSWKKTAEDTVKACARAMEQAAAHPLPNAPPLNDLLRLIVDCPFARTDDLSQWQERCRKAECRSWKLEDGQAELLDRIRTLTQELQRADHRTHDLQWQIDQLSADLENQSHAHCEERIGHLERHIELLKAQLPRWSLSRRVAKLKQALRRHRH